MLSFWCIPNHALLRVQSTGNTMCALKLEAMPGRLLAAGLKHVPSKGMLEGVGWGEREQCGGRPLWWGGRASVAVVTWLPQPGKHNASNTQVLALQHVEATIAASMHQRFTAACSQLNAAPLRSCTLWWSGRLQELIEGSDLLCSPSSLAGPLQTNSSRSRVTHANALGCCFSGRAWIGMGALAGASG